MQANFLDNDLGPTAVYFINLEDDVATLANERIQQKSHHLIGFPPLSTFIQVDPVCLETFSLCLTVTGTSSADQLSNLKHGYPDIPARMQVRTMLQLLECLVKIALHTNDF